MQYKLYEMYLGFRKQAPTRMSLIKTYWLHFQYASLTFFIIGMVVGASLNLLGNISTQVKIWPYIRDIIDWKKLGEILALEKNHN